MLLTLAIVGGFVWYVMNAEERDRVRRWRRGLHLALLRHLAIVLDGGARFVRAVRARHRGARVAFASLVVVAAATLFGGAFVHPPRDISADIEHLVSTESHITATYDTAAAQFRLGTMTAASLAQLIDRRITPELQAIGVRLSSLDHVRPQQLPSLAKAREYLRLRQESWRLRAAALHKRDLAALRRVETTERASLAALEAAVQAVRVM